MEDPQHASLLCERCAHLDSRLILSSTESSPWRPWLVADVVESAAATGCTFCCMLVDTLRLVGEDEKGRNRHTIDKALSKVQKMRTKSETVARFLAPKAERIQRERDGRITFFVAEAECDSDSITSIWIAVTGSKRGDTEWRVPYIVAPGPGMQQFPSMPRSELPSVFPFRGILFQSTLQSLTGLSATIQDWRQHCHDTHECWKPLSKRRDRNVPYDKLVMRRGELVRNDLRKEDNSEFMAPLERQQSLGSEWVVLPTRCLKIMLGDDGQCWFWLCDTSRSLGSYVILSHRWVPDTERVRTLKGNYASRVSDTYTRDIPPTIAPGDVTKVFQEAAQLTARLGIKYIWIDSLCIIQDDADDWKREATAMAKYYENAWLTIAANSTEGLYSPVVPEVLPSVVHLPYTDDAGQHPACLSIQPMDGLHLRDLYRKEITESELLSRGWVVQEWLLSPRIVAFSRTAGVFLICSEDPPLSALSTIAVERDRHRAPDMSDKNALDLSLLILSDIRKSWLRVVEAYSGLNLTNVASDRLIALAGVASAFGYAFPRALDTMGRVEYFCGLWLEGLARGLHWEPVDRSSRSFARVPGFPSWTWASVGRIKADGDCTDTRKIEAAAVRWHTQWPRMAQDCFEVRKVCHVPDVADPTSGQSRLEEARPISHYQLTHDFGIKNRFLALGIKGQLIRDLILEKTWPGVDDDPYRAAQLTANHLIDADTGDLGISSRPSKSKLYVDEAWHRVTQPGSYRDAAVGWASFDDPNLRVENTDSGPCIAGNRRRRIYGFPLSRAHEIPVLRNGSIVKVDINAVLFVVEVEALIDNECPRCFERVGVGRMIETRFAGGVFAGLSRKYDCFWLV